MWAFLVCTLNSVLCALGGGVDTRTVVTLAESVKREDVVGDPTDLFIRLRDKVRWFRLFIFQVKLRFTDFSLTFSQDLPKRLQENAQRPRTKCDQEEEEYVVIELLKPCLTFTKYDYWLFLFMLIEYPNEKLEDIVFEIFHMSTVQRRLRYKAFEAKYN